MARETVRIEGLDDVLRRLKALGAEASKRGGPARKAVRAAAVVIQKEAVKNLRAVIAEPNKGGKDRSSGLMAKSIKPVRARANRRNLKGETYTLKAGRSAIYPVTSRTSKEKPGGEPVQKIATILEYGGEHAGVRRGGHPWMRPAFLSKREQSVQVMKSTILKEIEKLEKKLAAR